MENDRLLTDEEKLRMEFARILHKALRQFETEGCPEAFDMRIHIDQLIKCAKTIRLAEPLIRADQTEKVLKAVGEDLIEPIVNFYVHTEQEKQAILSLWWQIKHVYGKPPEGMKL